MWVRGDGRLDLVRACGQWHQGFAKEGVGDIDKDVSYIIIIKSVWYFAVYVCSIDMIFHKGKIAETYNIGGFNEWKNIDIIKVVIKTVDRLLGRPEGADLDLITYVTDRKGHDMRYAIDSRKLQKELGWEPSLQFEEGIEETVKWYLDNQEWMDHVTSGEYQKYYEGMYCK